MARRLQCVVLAGLWMALAMGAFANGGFLQMRNGYFWDPLKAEYFIPRGMAYQTFNPPVGANQTFGQLAYDMREFKRFHANSVRAEMVWNEVERSAGVFDWSRSDALVAEAEAQGLKLFVLIGFQYAPAWFPEEWKALNSLGQRSVVLAYEHPEARVAYSNFIFQVTSRYRNSTAIGAWILGNEYAYFDLWEPARRHLGYDEFSLAQFRQYLARVYTNNIAALNANWGSNYTSFAMVQMPRTYPADRHLPAWHDLIQWRKESIGSYTALGSVAAQVGDPNHLRTYSMVGGLFGEADIHYTCEDAKTIVASCAAAGAPLHFWSINNYAVMSITAELRSADFGIAKHQAQSGLPVMISETGHSSSENQENNSVARQGRAIVSQMWEALMSGAIGTHIFTWNDRELFSGDYFPRERGFGIVQQNRLVKPGAYWDVAEMFRRMAQLNMSALFGASTNPAPDLQFFWSKYADMGWPRANHDNLRLWSALQRLGYQSWFIDEEQFERGDWRNARALVLSRCYQMLPQHLEMVATNVVPAGIHVHAASDLPGEYTPYHRRNPQWTNRMSGLFGLNVANAQVGWEGSAIDPNDMYRPLQFNGAGSLGTITPGYTDGISTWKIWHGLTAMAGSTIVTHRGMPGNLTVPALHVRDLGTARTAINTFGLGDSGLLGGQPATQAWDFRHRWLQAIYRNYFGMAPKVELTGAGSQHVFPDYRFCANGSVLLSLLNGQTNALQLTVNATTLFGGKTVENLTTGGIVEENSDGAVTLPLAPDQYVVLYAYAPGASLAGANRNKLWFNNAPTSVWPDGNAAAVSIGFDTTEAGLEVVASFERKFTRAFGQSVRTPISGAGTVALPVPVPDADLSDIFHVSTLDGAEYEWRAWIEQNGARVSEVRLPVQLLWGVRPTQITPMNNSYVVALEWEDLPSYLPSEGPSPLNRADQWDPLRSQQQYYSIGLQLLDGLGVVSESRVLTSAGTSSELFVMNWPGSRPPPHQWVATVQSVNDVSRDVGDSFEERPTGASTAVTAPWTSYVYSQSNTAAWFVEGVYTNRSSHGGQAAFIIVTNPPTSGAYAGFGFYYPFATAWALPVNASEWANYTFACDFKEESLLPCVIEVQLKDTRGGVLTLSKTYTPGAGGWDTISGSLDQFVVSTNTGFFDSSRVHDLFVNVQMRRSNTTYFANIDNIRFNGPEAFPTVPSPGQLHDSFEDRDGGEGPWLIDPWDAYPYSQLVVSNMMLNLGVHRDASHGGQSAFVVVTNPAAAGAFSGFLLITTNPLALPSNAAEWTNYWFSFDFKEVARRRCILEMQLKDARGGLLHYTNAYVPGPNGWGTIGARIDQFQQPVWSTNEFDPANVRELVVVAQMLDKNALYVGSFDNIQFLGPRSETPLGPVRGIYLSENDSTDSDGDGIVDSHETGTGIYVSATNAGTNRLLRDSDGDGASDWEELVAGTNPNSAQDALRITNIERAANAQLSWTARSNRIYSVEFMDDKLRVDEPFLPVESLRQVFTPTNGNITVVDPGASPARLYRLRVRQP